MNLFNALSRSLDERQQLNRAVTFNKLEDLKILIENGVDVNDVLLVQAGNRALHLAASKGHAQCIEKLLAAGADPDTTNHFGLTPLSMALRSNQTVSVHVLLSMGSMLTDPVLIWNSQEPGGDGYLWWNYPSDLLKLIMIATADMAVLDPKILQQFFVRFSQNEELVRTFLLVGNRLTNEQWTQLLTTYQGDMVSWLKGQHGVQSLQHYCRLAIRKCLKPNVLYGAKILPLPSKVQDYLVYKDGV